MRLTIVPSGSVAVTSAIPVYRRRRSVLFPLEIAVDDAQYWRVLGATPARTSQT